MNQNLYDLLVLQTLTLVMFFQTQKQKHDPYELVCFDAYDKQIVRFVRYLTVLPSL